jgi:hypothetical protein
MRVPRNWQAKAQPYSAWNYRPRNTQRDLSLSGGASRGLRASQVGHQPFGLDGVDGKRRGRPSRIALAESSYTARTLARIPPGEGFCVIDPALVVGRRAGDGRRRGDGRFGKERVGGIRHLHGSPQRHRTRNTRSTQGLIRHYLRSIVNPRRNARALLSLWWRFARLPLEDRAERVAAVEHRGGALGERSPVGHVPAEGVGEPDDHAEERADGSRVAQRLVRDTGRSRSIGIRLRQLVGAKGQFLEEDERRRELGSERCGAPVVDNRLPDFLTEGIRRDRAVGARSERALIE